MLSVSILIDIHVVNHKRNFVFLHVLEALEIRDNVTGQTEVRWKKRRGRSKVVKVTVSLKTCSASKHYP